MLISFETIQLSLRILFCLHLIIPFGCNLDSVNMSSGENNIKHICLPDYFCLMNYCSEGATCMLDDHNCATCHCPGEPTGLRCVSESKKFKNEETLDYKMVPPSNNNTTCLKARNITDPLCPGGFPCINGICEWTPHNSTDDPDALKIECVCDPTWIGEDCSICCDLACESGEYCFFLEGEKTCQPLHWRSNTRLLQQDPNTSPPMPVIVSSVVLLLVAGGAAVGLIYYIWWKKNCLIMRLLNKNPEDDGKSYEFDAFISYKSSKADEDFVVNQLYPHLEKQMGYKLCMHCRDFLGGVAIVDNIIWAVQSSRRTILVLSPDFVKSEWTRFEYQVAQREMLGAKHRIIPVIFREFDKDKVCEHLKVILSSVTYLEWPSEEEKQKKFWSRLAKALPKHPVASLSAEEGALSVSRTNSSGKIDDVSWSRSEENNTVRLTAINSV